MHIIYTVCLIILILTSWAVAEDETLCYAVVSIDGERKLHTKGDIFCADIDITECLRVVDIKKDNFILMDVASKETFILRPGEKAHIGGKDIIFEKAVEASSGLKR